MLQMTKTHCFCDAKYRCPRLIASDDQDALLQMFETYCCRCFKLHAVVYSDIQGVLLQSLKDDVASNARK